MDSFAPSSLATDHDGSLGRMDRYELRERLDEGAAGMLYRAVDTVVSAPVTLLILPAPLVATPGALDELRAELAPVAHFRHPGVAHLLHLGQLWELDSAARAETGLEPGAAALISDYPGGPGLDEWTRQFPGGQAPLPAVLDLLWELAEALDALHGAGLSHGSLNPACIRLSPQGPALLGASLDCRIHAALARLGLGKDVDETRSDLADLARLADRLLPAVAAAPWREVIEQAGEPGGTAFASARQFATALRNAAEMLPSTPVELPPPAAPAPQPAFTQPRPVREPVPSSRRTALLVNVALAVALFLALALAVGVILSRRRPATAPPSTERSWTPLGESTRLAPAFAWHGPLPAFQPGQALRFRLHGQTRILAAIIDPDHLTIEEHTGLGQSRVLDRHPLDTPWTDGDILTIAKGPDSLALARNGSVLARAPIPLDTWRLVRWDQTGDPDAAPLAYQRIGPLVFADDFMHGDGELGEWRPQTGTWTVHALQNPIRSANPFSLLGTGDDALIRVGQWFWRNYRLTCSAHPLKGSAFGLSLCRQDNGQSYDLRWSIAGEAAVLELSRNSRGERRSLARRELPFRPESWVQLAVSQLDGLLVVTVDGHETFRVLDPQPLLGGGIGLWTSGGEGTVFDDVTVLPVDQLAATGAAALPASLLPNGSPATAKDQPECPLGGVLLENATVEMTAPLAGRTAPLGLFARRSGPRQLRFLLVPGTPWQARIVATTPAGDVLLASENLDPPGPAAELAFAVLNREAWGTVNGRIAVYAGRVPVLGQGQAGAFADPAEPLAPSRLAVRPTPQLANIDTVAETFSHEQSMQNWNSPVLAWVPDYTSKLPVYWHRSDFWNDLAVTANVAELEQRDGAQVWGVALLDESGAADEGERRWQLFALPQGKGVFLGLPGAEPVALPASQPVQTLALERRGDFLLAKLNGRTVWNGRIPPGKDSLLRVGRIGRGATDDWAKAVEVRAASVQTYSFREAPVDWLPASGEWEVTNRWECDDRWSFFSGTLLDGPACLWNKRQHGENVSIEFFVGPKMDRQRGQWYEYAADFNAVICADGSDIASGYSFMFGGWDDRGSQIVRGNRILAENRRIVIPRQSSTHRRWFHIKLRKRGPELTFWVDGALVGSAKDDQPLAGNRFGLWTWKNGIMVAQVRVATESDMASVGMAAPPNPRPRTPYDP